jgi:formamidopyrimidine-DNA glycosylase
MPELPEVETVARQLAPFVVGRTVKGLRIFDPRLRSGRTPPMTGRRIRGVSRSGKRVLFAFSPRGDTGDPLWLAVHLRMTGRLLWRDAAAPGDLPPHRARFTLDHGTLVFADTRRFGTFDWYASGEAAAPTGVEPLSAELTPARFRALLAGTRQSLKAWLLRQDRLVGLGNIYASEILYRARLSPFREAGSLDAREAGRLRTATRQILARAIRNCGTTFSDFQDARGIEGSYQQYLTVYDRGADPCRRCRRPIERVVQQQRSTYYCPSCQV